MEAVYDSGASVSSCLSNKIYDSLKLKHSLTLEPSQAQLKAASRLPIETRYVVRFPVSLGRRIFEQNFYVSAKSEADCLISLDCLKDHQCDPLFWKKLRLIGDTFVPFYHKVYTIQTDQLFLVVYTDNVRIPAGNSMIIPAHILVWKRPPLDLAAVVGYLNGSKQKLRSVLTMYCSNSLRKWSRWL